jgi:2'-5' RNA ligase
VSGGDVRAFFALELPEPVRHAAAAVAGWLRDQPGGRGVRWVRAESLHVTLRFLGNVAPARIHSLAAAAAHAAAGCAPFELAIGALRAFPSERRPRVVALDLEPEAPLAALAAALERAVVAEGFAAEPRPFRAHLTLGRVQGRRGPRLADAPAVAPERFAVRDFVLMQSRLGPGGSTYTPLERIALGGGAHPASETIESTKERET